jgi:hypothetical protein
MTAVIARTSLGPSPKSQQANHASYSEAALGLFISLLPLAGFLIWFI